MSSAACSIVCVPATLCQDELRGAGDRPVDMTLGGEVHHLVHVLHQCFDECHVEDVPLHEPQPFAVGHRREVDLLPA